MLKVEHTSVMNIEGALRGARNPMKSWDKSDSFKCDGVSCHFEVCPYYDEISSSCGHEGEYIIGFNDLESICYDNFDVAESEEDDDECSN